MNKSPINDNGPIHLMNFFFSYHYLPTKTNRMSRVMMATPSGKFRKTPTLLATIEQSIKSVFDPTIYNADGKMSREERTGPFGGLS